MGSISQLNGQMMALALIALFFVAIVYAVFVNWLGERREGYVSLLVVGGVIITLAFVAVIDWRAAILCLAAFVASGTPMIVGDIVQNVSAREKAKRLQRRIAEEQFRRSQALIKAALDEQFDE